MSMLIHDLSLSRGACDRCHGQKLRCRQENSSEGCLRCQRAGVRCTPRVLRSARQRTRSHAAQTSPIHGKPQYMGKPAAEEVSRDASEPLCLSPTSLLNVPSDLDLGLDFSSLQSEFGGAPMESLDLHSSMDLGPLQSHLSSPPFDQGSSHQGHGGLENHQQDRPRRSSYRSSSSASSMLPHYSQDNSTHSGHLSLQARNLTPKSLICESQDGVNTDLVNFDQRERAALNTDSEDTSTDSGYGQSVSRPHSYHSGEFQGSYNNNAGQQGKKSIADPNMTSWIRKLSDINVELHRHMLSIPPIEVEQSIWTDGNDNNGTGNDHNPNQRGQELAVDCTFRLSHQYMEILTDIFSRFKTRQNQGGSPRGALALDQPSQLLVLSSYLCLVESYDRCLQHIKTWNEFRLKMGGGEPSSEKTFPTQLPSVSIGSFKLLRSSSTRPLVITCIIEAMIMQIHDLVDEMMRPVNVPRNGGGMMSNSTPGPGEQGGSSCDGLSGVAKVTLQAIRAKEDSTMKLIHVVWKLAVRCGFA